MVELAIRLSPERGDLGPIGLGCFPLEGRVEAIVAAGRPAGWRPSNLAREHYLDLAEAILREAVTWQNADGAIIDPVLGREWAQTTSRFASSGAVLLHFGRMDALLEPVSRAMDWVCSRLPQGLMDAADFQTREIMTAWLCLRGRVAPERLDRWAAGIRAIEPERIYRYVRPDGRNLETLHNWNIYAMAGEWLRQREGLGPQEGFLWGRTFIAKYLPVHLRNHFSPYGMYRDPGDPITYDITTRLQLATMLAFGYDGPHRAEVDELLRRGGLTMLLFVTPDGLAPFGGRSDQFQFREAIVAALCELEARRYRDTQPVLAGAFKRQARRSAGAIDRWLFGMRPPRHVKNGFAPAERWGLDAYGHYSIYSLLAASFLGLAALFADETIAESPCPAEMGGFVLELPDAFHKVFASAGGTYVQIDTRADTKHNATGLGSIQQAGAPTELALAMPFTNTPSYSLKDEFVPPRPVAIGPAWRVGGQWEHLAALCEGLASQLDVREQTPGHVAWQIVYTTPSGVRLREQYVLEPGVLRIAASAESAANPVEAMRLFIPLLMTDGQEEARRTRTAGEVRIDYRGWTYAIAFDEPPLAATIDDCPIGNRNGLYRTLILEAPADRIAATLRISAAGSE